MSSILSDVMFFFIGSILGESADILMKWAFTNGMSATNFCLCES